MGFRNSSIKHHRIDTMESFWVVKVQIKYGTKRERWCEYKIEIEPDNSYETYREAQLETQGRFDVLLIKSSFNNFRTWRVANELCPHLNSTPSEDLILENVTEAEAMMAKEKLEAVGAIVEVIPAFAYYEIGGVHLS